MFPGSAKNTLGFFENSSCLSKPDKIGKNNLEFHVFSQFFGDVVGLIKNVIHRFQAFIPWHVPESHHNFRRRFLDLWVIDHFGKGVP